MGAHYARAGAQLCCADCGSRDLKPAEHVVSKVRHEYTCNVGEWTGRKVFAAWCNCGWRRTGDRDVVVAAAAVHTGAQLPLDAA